MIRERTIDEGVQLRGPPTLPASQQAVGPFHCSPPHWNHRGWNCCFFSAPSSSGTQGSSTRVRFFFARVNAASLEALYLYTHNTPALVHSYRPNSRLPPIVVVVRDGMKQCRRVSMFPLKGGRGDLNVWRVGCVNERVDEIFATLTLLYHSAHDCLIIEYPVHN